MCRCFLSLLWHVAPPGQYHAAAEAKQFRFMYLDACAWRLPRWPHRAAVAIKVPSPDPSRSYPAHCVHGVMDRALLFALRTSMAEHAPSRVAGLGALTLPTLPSAFPGRRGLAHPCHPCCCQGLPQPAAACLCDTELSVRGHHSFKHAFCLDYTKSTYQKVCMGDASASV